MDIKFIIKPLMTTLICFAATSSLAEKKASEEDYNYNYAAINNRCAVYDPYETLNRKVFMFNSVLDTVFLRPVTKWYDKATNDYAKGRVGNFVDNISEPLSTINYTLQGKSEGAFKSFWRFTINSTFGVLGLFDVASKIGLTAEPQTLGNTMGHYGVGSGPYIVLPIYGGMGARDVMDPLMMSSVMNPAKHFLHKDFKLVLTGTKTIHSRNQIMPFTDHVTKNSLDPYIAVRDAIINERESKMIYPEDFKCPTVNNK
ncbi:MAG: VacJ family lipoprotein [Rickettsiaceae bacterium]|nr:VacJ family lipoprotein [Rickettsiaceae bacterium]